MLGVWPGALVYVSFEQWTGNRDVATLGSNAGSTAIPFQRWRHFKEAFAPEIVQQAIKSSKTVIKSCIDPFGGSGTTGLACQFLGVDPTIVEVNPYLADLIEAKLSNYDTERLTRELGLILRQSNNADVEGILAALPSTFVEPGVNERWIFDFAVARRILSIRASTAELSDACSQRFFKVILGGTLLELSNAVVNGKGRRYRRNWTKRRRTSQDVDAAFSTAAVAAIAEIDRYSRRATTSHTVVRGDSRTSIGGMGPFDLAVFSPPYPNSFDYTDVYNIELWMLGYLGDKAGNRSLRESTLASHVQIHRPFGAAPTGSDKLSATIDALELAKPKLWNPHIPGMIGGYFSDLVAVTESLVTALKPGAAVWAVVGDSRYAGVAINVADVLAELASARGLAVEQQKVLRVMRTSAQQGGDALLAESLIVLRCP